DPKSCPGRPMSAGFDVAGPDYLSPLSRLFGDELAEVGRRAGKRRGAQVGKARLQLWIGEARVDRTVELADDLDGRVPGRADAVPAARLVTGHELGDRRHLRERLRARGACHRQRTKLSRLDVLNRRRQ